MPVLFIVNNTPKILPLHLPSDGYGKEISGFAIQTRQALQQNFRALPREIHEVQTEFPFRKAHLQIKTNFARVLRRHPPYAR